MLKKKTLLSYEARGQKGYLANKVLSGRMLEKIWLIITAREKKRTLLMEYKFQCIQQNLPTT